MAVPLRAPTSGATWKSCFVRISSASWAGRMTVTEALAQAPSLAGAGGCTFAVMEENGASLLMQVGGAASEFGLSPPLRRELTERVPVYVYPFSSSDYQNIEVFAGKIDRSFLPRPQRNQPAIAAGNRHPEISLPAVFDAYRQILQETKVNLASTVQLSATREM